MKRHFLLVDDDVAELRLFSEAFKQMNVDCKCTYAKDIQHAMQIMQYVMPEKLFVRLDPDIAGNLEQIRVIRKDKKLKDAEIIVYCENMHYYNFLARGHGADHCLDKPIASDKICEMMDGIFNRQAQT
jgi:CheY-like chemotaxis protein